MQSSKIYLFLVIVASVFLALVTFLQPGVSLAPGLDSSWAYGINYTFEKNLVLGRDVYFTFGPLGFLEHTAPFMPSMFNFSAWFWFLCSICSCSLIFLLCREAASNHWLLLLNLALGLALVFIASNHVQRLLLIVYTSAFLHWRTQQPVYLFIMAAASIIGLLIKFSHGTTALALYLPYVLAIALRNSSWRTLARDLLMLPAIYLVCWLAIYGSLAGAAGYIQGGLEFSSGSISAMASSPKNNWWAIAAFYLAFLIGTAVISLDHRKSWIAMPLCFLGPLFIWSKYAFGREDTGHLAFLMPFVLYLGLLWMIAAQQLIRKIICGLAVIACYFAWQEISLTVGGTVDYKPQITFYKPDSFESRWKQEDIRQIIKAEVDRQLAPLQLDASLRQRIGDSTVDIYPWETLIAYPNGLNWKPRPIYQNYITYTPWLDQKNAAFFASASAPEFIIWHYHAYQDIDNRYPFSSDPLTLQAILNHYHLDVCQQPYCLWRRSPTPRLRPVAAPSATTANWNTWVDVPHIAHADIIRANVQTRRTLAGKLNLALWKEGSITIDYQLDNDEIRSHTLLIDNAVSGAWISPYLTERTTTIQPKMLGRKELQTWLAAKPAEGYIEKIETASQGIHVVGWGLVPFKPTQNQQLQLLFYNDKHAYLAPAQSRPRPGITEHFGKTGIVDLGSSGIDEVVESDGMMPGNYRIAFVVTNDGERRVHLQMPALSITIDPAAKQNTHNVKAVRIRSGRPWAFMPSLTLQWDAQSFNAP